MHHLHQARKRAHLCDRLWHWLRLGLSIFLGHEEAPKVLVDDLGGKLHSILICKVGSYCFSGKLSERPSPLSSFGGVYT